METVKVFKNHVIKISDENSDQTEGIPSIEWNHISRTENPRDYLPVYAKFPGIKVAKIYLDAPN